MYTEDEAPCSLVADPLPAAITEVLSLPRFLDPRHRPRRHHHRRSHIRRSICSRLAKPRRTPRRSAAVSVARPCPGGGRAWQPLQDPSNQGASHSQAYG